MSSWFSSDTFQHLKDNATSLAGNAAEIAGKVVEKGIAIDHEMVQKLTLNTPELSAERKQMDQEERRKEVVRDKLAGMLPWETRDPERDILVDECKEAILKLSAEAETFTGPWKMPEKGVNLKKKKKKKKHHDDEEHDNTHEEEEDEEEDDDDDEEENEKAQKASAGPSQASIEKLEKLEPLPPLLQDFDLDMHVGLIQRLLDEDPELVKMQSTLSGGGAREKVFWHNYFFHCAFTRYEAGLSIDEIWSEENTNNPAPPTTTSSSTAAGAEGAATTTDGTDDAASAEEQTITFTTEASDSTGVESSATPEKAFHAEPATDPSAPFNTETAPATDADAVKDNSDNTGSKDSSDFELVGKTEGTAAANDDDADADGAANVVEDEVDYELDELEEEIARELEDM